MSLDDNTRYQAISRVENGEAKRDIAEDLGVSYATVMRWHKEYLDAKDNGTLSDLLDIDKLILATAETLKSSPVLVDEINEGVKQAKKKLSALEVLQGNFITTAEALNSQIKSRAMSVESTSELSELVESLCSLQNAFFNKNTTQVNVQNNYDIQGGTKYGNLLNDKPVN